MNSDRMYQRSSIGRPIDPAYPTNRAMLVIIPVAGLIGTAIAYWRGGEGWGLLLAAVGAAGTAFGGWALARELSPDDELGAFISMALAVAVAFATGHTAVLYIITTMMLIRIVNRTVGLPARATDSIAVLALTVWCVYSTDSAVPAALAMIAFGLDASLAPPLQRQWIFAAASLIVGLVYLATHGGPLPVSLRDTGSWILGLQAVTAFSFLGMIIGTREWSSLADATDQPLEPSRIRAGMVIGLLSALGLTLALSDGNHRSLPIWGILLGVVLGRVRQMIA